MRRSFVFLMAGVAGTGLLAGCGSSDSAAEPETIDVSHVHGLGVDPSDPSRVLIATHVGLVAYSDGSLSKVGELSTDLMGFSIGAGGQFIASGHPGYDEDGPAALGVIVSSDGGEAWEPVALSGEADFHALDAWSDGVIGFDGAIGALRISDDGGTSWSQGATDVAAFDLAADETAIVATTEDGLRVSTDGGLSFAAASTAPLLQLVDFTADGQLVGIDPDGEVHASGDLTAWDSLGAVDGQVQALTTGPDDDVWVATTEGLQRSTDGGASFSTALAW